MAAGNVTMELSEKNFGGSDQLEPSCVEEQPCSEATLNSTENMLLQLLGSDDIEMLYEWFSS